MKAPRIMLAGTHSGVGKTTISTAIMGLLRKRGYKVNPFKVGPDYIDPSYHLIATGLPGRNLDCWMMEPSKVYELFYRTAANNNISVIEGVMGLFDGANSISDEGSSAQVAKITKTPVILIVDVRSMARSAAAVVLGFKNMDPDLNIAGVILNRVGSDRHLSMVQEAIEEYCGIPVVGYIKKNAQLELPSRHLGLVPTGEGRELPERVSRLADIIEEGIFVEKLLAIAEGAPSLEEPINPELFPPVETTRKVRIGLAKDEAFSFYYQDGLEILENFGAELVPFSPIHDKKLPDGLDGLYIGGGYPEIYVEELAANKSLLEEIQGFGKSGRPIFGECGGLMYLSKGIYDLNGSYYPMVSLIPGKCKMKSKLVRLGYVKAGCAGENILGLKGTALRGHEFHYSDIEMDSDADRPAFSAQRNRSKEDFITGYAKGNILASYIHIHFGSNINLAKNFIEKCRLTGRSYKNGS